MMTSYKVKTPKLVGNTVVKAYKGIENGVVTAYKKIENAFVDTFLEDSRSSRDEDGTVPSSDQNAAQ